MREVADPLVLPRRSEEPVAYFSRAAPLEGSPGEAYVQRRGIPVAVASATGLRYAADCGGRPAVVVLLREQHDGPTAVHARYLHADFRQDKMLTFGPAGGVIAGLDGWRADPLIVVEGLCDALSLASCGCSTQDRGERRPGPRG